VSTKPGQPQSTHASTSWIAQNGGRKDKRAAFAVRDAGSLELLGEVELNTESGQGRARISYWTYAKARNRGVASGAVRIVCAFGFEQLGLRRIQLAYEQDNLASGFRMRRVPSRLPTTDFQLACGISP